MTVFENKGRYDASNVWFEGGAIRAYDKKDKAAHDAAHRLRAGAFQGGAFDGFPRDEVVDLADVQKALLERGELAGYEIAQRFYEIGSHAGPGGARPAASPRRISRNCLLAFDALPLHPFNHPCPIQHST
jgi:hypothetical protein